MIHFVLHEHHPYAVGNFLETWGRSLRPRVTILSHQALRHVTKLDAGTYVFGDVDRLTADERALSADIADQLAAGGCQILNHPRAVKWRHELCHALRSGGMNDYCCFRATEDWSKAKFPVFVRSEDDHGSLDRELLHDAQSVQRVIDSQPAPERAKLLVVEYLDTADADGVYRKYSAIKIGPQLFARHILYSRGWLIKYADLTEPAMVAEEDRYLDDFDGDADHAEQVRRVFDLAGVDYGRVDYSLHNGRVQTWEINLSPHLSSAPDRIAPARLQSQAAISRRISDAIAALDVCQPTETRSVPIRHDPRVLRRLGVGARHRALRIVGKIGGRIERIPGVRSLAYWYGQARWMALH